MLCLMAFLFCRLILYVVCHCIYGEFYFILYVSIRGGPRFWYHAFNFMQISHNVQVSISRYIFLFFGQNLMFKNSLYKGHIFQRATLWLGWTLMKGWFRVWNMYLFGRKCQFLASSPTQILWAFLEDLGLNFRNVQRLLLFKQAHSSGELWYAEMSTELRNSWCTLQWIFQQQVMI